MSTARRLRILLAAAVTAALVAGCGSGPKEETAVSHAHHAATEDAQSPTPVGGPKGQKAKPDMTLPDFTLTDQHGRPFRLHDQKGGTMVLFPGYTYCPDVCPTTVGLMAKAHDALGADASKAVFVFVTVDPERDTPERLKAYFSGWNFPVVAVTGSETEMARVWEGLRIGREREDLGNGTYAVSHSNRAWLVDPAGRVRLSHTLGTTAESLADDLRWLLHGN